MVTVVKEKKILRGLAVNAELQTEEVLAFCPGCKALQTVWLKGNELLPTLKFKQISSQVYHNCGSKQPCRLYPSS
jgi:hypothetical protein